MIVFQTFFPPIIEKKQQHLEFTLNVKPARAFIPHMDRYHPPLPPPILNPLSSDLKEFFILLR